MENRSFFEKYSSTNLVKDPIPIKVLRQQVTSGEMINQALDWSIQYLYQKECPSNILSSLLHMVHQSLIKDGDDLTLCQVEGETNDISYQPLKLMQAVISKVDGICLRFKEEHEIIDKEFPSSLANKSEPYPFESSYCTFKNSRRSLEDRMVILPHLDKAYSLNTPISYFGVFDGHNGMEAASYTSANLHHYLVTSKHFPENLKESISDAFEETDKMFIKKCKMEKNLKSGTTAVIAILTQGKIVVAWAGDSLAYLVKQNKILNIVNPHKPDRKDEKRRIRNLGGDVFKVSGMWRVNGNLAISRAIGDIDYKPSIVSTPECKTIDIDGTEYFLILSCDGLTDFLSSYRCTQIIVEYLKENPTDVNGVSRNLVREAKKAGSSDNITVIVIFLKSIEDILKAINNSEFIENLVVEYTELDTEEEISEDDDEMDGMDEKDDDFFYSANLSKKSVDGSIDEKDVIYSGNMNQNDVDDMGNNKYSESRFGDAINTKLGNENESALEKSVPSNDLTQGGSKFSTSNIEQPYKADQIDTNNSAPSNGHEDSFESFSPKEKVEEESGKSVDNNLCTFDPFEIESESKVIPSNSSSSQIKEERIIEEKEVVCLDGANDDDLLGEFISSNEDTLKDEDFLTLDFPPTKIPNENLADFDYFKMGTNKLAEDVTSSSSQSVPTTEMAGLYLVEDHLNDEIESKPEESQIEQKEIINQDKNDQDKIFENEREIVWEPSTEIELDNNKEVDGKSNVEFNPFEVVNNFSSPTDNDNKEGESNLDKFDIEPTNFSAIQPEKIEIAEDELTKEDIKPNSSEIELEQVNVFQLQTEQPEKVNSNESNDHVEIVSSSSGVMNLVNEANEQEQVISPPVLNKKEEVEKLSTSVPENQKITTSTNKKITAAPSKPTALRKLIHTTTTEKPTARKGLTNPSSTTTKTATTTAASTATARQVRTNNATGQPPKPTNVRKPTVPPIATRKVVNPVPSTTSAKPTATAPRKMATTATTTAPTVRRVPPTTSNLQSLPTKAPMNNRKIAASNPSAVGAPSKPSATATTRKVGTSTTTMPPTTRPTVTIRKIVPSTNATSATAASTQPKPTVIRKPAPSNSSAAPPTKPTVIRKVTTTSTATTAPPTKAAQKLSKKPVTESSSATNGIN